MLIEGIVTLLFISANILLLSLTVTIGYLFLSKKGLSRLAFVSLLVGLLGAVLACVIPTQSLAELATILHEGTTARTLKTIFFGYDHAGIWFGELMLDLSFPVGLPLLTTVRFNIFATTFLAGATFCVGSYMLRTTPCWPLLVAACLVSPSFLLPAVSETPAPWIGIYALASLLALAYSSQVPRTAVRTGSSFLLLFLSSFLAVTTRVELVLLSIPAFLSWAQTQGLFTAFFDRAASALRRTLRLAIKHFVLVAVGVLLLSVTAEAVLNSDLLRAQVSAFDPSGFLWRLVWGLLNPLHTSSLSALTATAEWFTPLVLVLTLVGAWAQLREGRRFALFPLFLFLLAKLYAVAGHGVGNEYMRYWGTLTVPLVFTAMFGAQQLAQMGLFGFGQGKARVVTVLAGLLFAFGARTILQGYRVVVTGEYLEQTEARFLVTLALKHPECAFVAHVASPEPRTVVFSTDHRIFGSLESTTLPTLAEASPYLPSTYNCLYYYRSLDCSRDAQGTIDCSPPPASRLEVRKVLTGRQYSWSDEYGRIRAPAVVASYRIDPAELQRWPSTKPSE